MKTLDLYLNEQLKNEEFRKEWEENQPEMDIIRAMADARISICLFSFNHLFSSIFQPVQT